MKEGAAFGGMPLMDRFEGDITQQLCSGDVLRVMPAQIMLMVKRG